jgi:hypothetical protein
MNELLGHPLGVPLRVRRKGMCKMGLPNLGHDVELNKDYELLSWRKQTAVESAKRRKENGTSVSSDERVLKEYDKKEPWADDSDLLSDIDPDLPF